MYYAIRIRARGSVEIDINEFEQISAHLYLLGIMFFRVRSPRKIKDRENHSARLRSLADSKIDALYKRTQMISMIYQFFDSAW